MMSNQRRSFPELVDQNPQQAATYLAAQGKFTHRIYHVFTIRCYTRFWTSNFERRWSDDQRSTHESCSHHRRSNSNCCYSSTCCWLIWTAQRFAEILSVTIIFHGQRLLLVIFEKTLYRLSNKLHLQRMFCVQQRHSYAFDTIWFCWLMTRYSLTSFLT